MHSMSLCKEQDMWPCEAHIEEPSAGLGRKGEGLRPFRSRGSASLGRLSLVFCGEFWWGRSNPGAAEQGNSWSKRSSASRQRPECAEWRGSSGGRTQPPLNRARPVVP